MDCKTALIFYYLRENRNSYNALAGALERYRNIKTINVSFFSHEKELLEKAPDIAKKHKKTIIGVSFATPQSWYIKDLIHKLKGNTGNHTLFLAGGPHPTGAPLETLRMGFDLVIHGEGEDALTDVLHKVNHDEDCLDIKGLSYLDKNGECVFTGKRDAIDINHYNPVSGFFSKYGPIEITRGCPYACGYCQVSHLFGVKPRHRSIENILESVRIIKKHESPYLRFITPNAFTYGSENGQDIHYEHLDALLSGVRRIVGGKGKIFFGSFPSEVRPEHVNVDTVNMVKQYADNDNLVIGAQSGSPRMLDLIRRGHDVESIYKAVEITRQAGLKVNVDFIFGLPDETDEDLSATLQVIRDLHQSGARIHAHTFIPLPQTPLKKEKPSRMSPLLRKEVNRLCSNGILYGTWRKQGKMAAKIAATGENHLSK